MADSKIKRTTIRHIEAEIYSYYRTLTHLEMLRQDIVLAATSASIVTPHRSSCDRTVERRAMSLADSILLREMERITSSIQSAYRRAREEMRRVIWVKYGLAIDWQPPADLIAMLGSRNRSDIPAWEMAQIAGVDESTFYRYRYAFVSAIAEELGWH